MTRPGGMALDRVQRWMQAVIVHPGSVEEAAGGEGARAELAPERVEELILPSAHLSPLERVGIYHGMYLLRMEEALASDYPGLKHLLGERAFFALVRDYVQRHPSRSFSLNPLGSRLPEFLREEAQVPRRGFCVELARLELAITEVFDAPEERALDAPQIAAVPESAWEGARLVPIPAFRLLALRYPAGAYLDSLDNPRHEHPPLRRRDTWLAVYRRQYSVYRQELSRHAHDLLADLVAGATVGQAVAAALRRRGRGRPGAEQLFRWFREWAASGMFARVEIG